MLIPNHTMVSDGAADAVQAQPLAVDAVKLSWEPVQQAKGYRLYSDMGSGFGVYVLKAETKETSYIDTHLRPAAIYRYRVVALIHDEEMLLADQKVTTPPQPVMARIGNRMLMTLPTPTRAIVIVTPAPTPLPPDTIILGLVSASDHIDEVDGYLNIVGEVRNDSNVDVIDPVINAVFYGADGERQEEISGKAVLDALAPGECSPFVLKAEQPAPDAYYSLRATARADGGIHARSTPALRVVSSRRFEDDVGLYHIAGVVENKSTRRIERARVVVILYDRGGGVVNVGFGYPSPATLASGERGDFDVTFTYYPKVIRHAVLVVVN